MNINKIEESEKSGSKQDGCMLGAALAEHQNIKRPLRGVAAAILCFFFLHFLPFVWYNDGWFVCQLLALVRVSVCCLWFSPL